MTPKLDELALWVAAGLILVTALCVIGLLGFSRRPRAVRALDMVGDVSAFVAGVIVIAGDQPLGLRVAGIIMITTTAAFIGHRRGRLSGLVRGHLDGHACVERLDKGLGLHVKD